MSRRNNNGRRPIESAELRQLAREVREARRAARTVHRARSIELRTVRVAGGATLTTKAGHVK